jgi:carboxylesterase type B
MVKTWSCHQEIQFDAIVDGWVIPEQPARIFAEGRQACIPVLVGGNADEATVFGPWIRLLKVFCVFLVLRTLENLWDS